MNVCRSYKYAGYQRTFSLLETLNIVTLLVSVQITHWILNYKFWNYGNEVINYLTVYGSHLSRGKRIHDPMCELFPTEVRLQYTSVSDPHFYQLPPSNLRNDCIHKPTCSS